MFLTANEFIKCLLIPYILVGGLSVLFLVLSKRKDRFVLLGVVLFVFLWRMLAGISSSRYCIAIYLYFIITICLFLKILVHKESKLFDLSLLLFGCFCFVFNLATIFSSFRNVFYIDMQNDIKDILSADHTTVFVEEKDFKRIACRKEGGKIIMIPAFADISHFMEYSQSRYSFWLDDARFIVSKSNKNVMDQEKDLNLVPGEPSKYKTIRKYISNKNKTKVFFVFSREKFLPEAYSYFDQVGTSFFKELRDNGVLKAYNLEMDTFVFQQKDKLIWLIGTDIDQKAEIIFQLSTDRPDLLPPKRQKYGFDNRGFHINPQNDVKKIGRYQLLERSIPKEYPITLVRVGINKDGTATWFQSFPLSDYSFPNTSPHL